MNLPILGYLRFLVPGVLALTLGCSDSLTSQAEGELPEAAGSPADTGLNTLGDGTVLETVDGGGYTYIRVELPSGEVWAAGPETVVSVGDTVTLPEGMPMKDFHSKTLNRTFDVLYFVGTIQTGTSVNPAHLDKERAAKPEGSSTGQSAQPVLRGIAKPEGGVTVSELYSKKDALSGQKVLVRGQVVKFNPAIMNKNWLHIEDGSGSGGEGNLTVTTLDTANVGDVVLVRGTLVLNKDFGFGYQYEVLVEDAKVITE